MTISSIASTPSQASLASLSLSVRSFSGPPRAEGADRVSEVRKLRHGEHDHHHDHHRRASRRDENESSSAAFTTLKLKIEQTFSSLIGAASSDDDNALSAPGFEGQFRARFQLSGPDGTLHAKLKIKLDADSAQNGADFAAALQGFAQTLFAALRTLYGGEQPVPTSQALPPFADSPSAPPVSPAPIPTPALTNAPAPAPSTTPTSGLPAPAVDTAPVVTAPPTAISPVASNPKPVTVPAVTNPSSSSLSIKLRLTYDSFENNLGPLVNQLAQPNLGDALPGLTALLGDLADRFGTLLSQTSGAGAGAPSLQEFLTALSGSFFGPKPDAAATQLPAGPPTDAATEVTAGAAKGPALPAELPAAAPAPAAAQHYTALTEYKQVLAYSDAGSSVRLQASLSARVVYEVA